jgi:hypothetical protein
MSTDQLSNEAIVGQTRSAVDPTAGFYLDKNGNPIPVTEETPLPVILAGNVTGLSNGFIIPPHNDVEIQYALSAYPTKATYMTFRLNGTPVFWLMFSYDQGGNLTRIQPD